MRYVTNPRAGAPEGTEKGSWLPAVEGKTSSLSIISLCLSREEFILGEPRETFWRKWHSKWASCGV